MSDFIVSARKYRPSTFEYVLSQSNITNTLKNAIKTNQLAQAFLFCGPRGVGKTTCARILAKIINCEQMTANIEPCNTCTSCISFNKHSSMNVYELDAASNNSVEDIRDLVEQVRYAPQVGSYKIYIIDEVHMLSNAAFNAFLKTLEEPPSYAIFILATTERHKIIPTILSRCQVFSFQRIQPQDIVAQLKSIATQEHITYDDEALHLISQKAEGSMRDALSIFDLITVSSELGNQLTYQATIENLQVLDQTYYFKFIEAFLKADIVTSLITYNQIVRAGFDSHHFIIGLSEHLRNLLMCQNSATIKLLEATDNIKHMYKEQAQHTTPHFLLSALNLLNQCDIHYKSSKNQRLHVELVLINIATLNKNSTVTHQEPNKIDATDQGNDITKQVVTKEQQDAIEQSATVTNPTTILPKKKIEVAATIAKIIPSKKHSKTEVLQETISIPKIEQLKRKTYKIGTTTPEETIVAAEVLQLPFSEKQLKSCWHTYINSLKEQGNLAAYNVLNQTIQLNGTTIILTLVNPIQQDILDSIKIALLQNLRIELKNSKIEIKGLLVSDTQTKKPYTEQEKFNYLAKKNNSLLLLQKELKLEIVY